MQENNVIDAEIISETPASEVSPAAQPEATENPVISEEEAAHISLIHLNKNKLRFENELYTMNKKNVKLLLNFLLFYPLQKDLKGEVTKFPKSLENVYGLTQEILNDKAKVLNYLEKKAEEEIKNGKASE